MQVMDSELSMQTLADKDKPYVRFESKPREDKKKSVEVGRVVMVDQDYAVTTVPGGKATNIERVEVFFEKMKAEVRCGRVLPHWMVQWEQDYEQFKKGQAIPLDGTPIRGWKLLRDAQQEELIRMNILTVEQLANLSDEGLQAIGMGAIDMKRRAKAWIEQNADKEAGTLKIASLEQANESLKKQVEFLSGKLEELAGSLNKKDKAK